MNTNMPKTLIKGLGYYSGAAYGAARVGADAMMARTMMTRVAIGAGAALGGGMMASSDNPLISAAGMGVLGAGAGVGLAMSPYGAKAAEWMGSRGRFGRGFRGGSSAMGGYAADAMGSAKSYFSGLNT